MKHNLTEAEAEIVALIIATDPLDLTLEYLARQRNTTPGTIKLQLNAIYRKLGAPHGRNKLIRLAMRLQGEL